MNPVTGASLVPRSFHKSPGLFRRRGVLLPYLDLSRVYVLTSGNTCSAEAIINGLRGIDVSNTDRYHYVWQPTGFESELRSSYFSIQFKGVNAKGYGDIQTAFPIEFGDHRG